MRKFRYLLYLIGSVALFTILVTNCKEEPTPVTPPQEPPVYENGTGEIGSIGGTVKITDPTSKLSGAYVDIPEGALNQNYTISISEETDKTAFPDDSTAIMIKLEPEGLVFSKSIEIGLPYKTGANVTTLKAFYFDSTDNIISEIPIKSIDQSKLIIIAETNHFSGFVASDGSARITSEFYYNNNKISVRTYIDGYFGNNNLGLSGIATLPWSWFFGIYNAKQAIDKAQFLISGASPHGLMRVKLKKKVNFWFDPTLEEKSLIFVRNDMGNEKINGILYYDSKNNGNPSDITQLYETPEQNSTEREEWYSGDALLFHFDYTPNSSDQYYIEVTWALTADFTYHASGTKKYNINTFDNALKTNQMHTENIDVNGNYVIDDYEANGSPNIPSNPSPPNNSIDQSLTSDISWTGTDPDNDPLTYEVYFGTTSNPPIVRTNYTSTTLDLGNLEANTKYYWKIVAKDDHDNTTEGPVWNFTTKNATGGNQPPNEPSNPNPENGALNQPTNTDLSWTDTDPDNDPLTYDIYFGTNSNPPLVASSQTNTTYNPGSLNENTQYYWKIVAKDDHNNSTTGPIWNFTTESGGGGGGGEPCPGIPTITYEGKTYNTVQIGDQCWLKENLDVGTMIQDNENSTDNGLIEKYCFVNNNANCSTFGGLYQWNEAMQYVTTPGTQGICPDGWHIPTLAEFETLKDAVGGDGNSLKAIGQGTGNGAGTNSSGFSALLAGYRGESGGFGEFYYRAFLWSSSRAFPWVYDMTLFRNNNNIEFFYDFSTRGYSVRCLKDNEPPNQPSNPNPANNAVDQPTDLTLSWESSDPDGDPLVYDIYFGTNNPPTQLVSQNQTETSLIRTGLNNNTVYYWKIIAKDDHNNSTEGPVWNFTTESGGTAPDPPVPLSPPNGATDISTSPTLSWNVSSGADSYALQVSTSAQFTSFVYNQSGLTNTNQQINGLSNSTIYYWRVSATNGYGTSNWSTVWNFTTIGTPPNPPILLSPPNGATDISTSPTLSWNASSGADSYTLQVSTSDQFTSFVYNQSGLTNTSQQISGLSNSTIYYWRVNATNGYGTSNWSSVWNFTTIGTPPAPPALLSPPNGATDISTSPTLSWNASSGADSYTLQVSTSAQFTSFVYNQSGLTNTNQQISGLDNSTIYYWRVSAINGYGTSNWSGVWNFTTESAVPPDPPVLLSPPNGATDVFTSPTLSWNASSGANSYTLQVSTSDQFTSFVYNQSGLTNTSQQISGLDTSATYFWRANATNNYGTSGWSDVWNFMTVSGGGVPCPGIPIVVYEGKTYNTVQIETQCWLKENLDVGTMIQGSEDATDNGIIEKHCYDDDPANCETYGGLYQWNETMQYVTTEGAQGICPDGWHIPTLDEFQTLSDAVGGNGNALKAIGQGSGGGVGTNTSGFSALLAGYSYANGYFSRLGENAFFWSSTDWDWNFAESLRLNYHDSNILLPTLGKSLGFSVRCLKD